MNRDLATDLNVGFVSLFRPDAARRTWPPHTCADEPVAIDGKHIRGAARHNPHAKHLLVAAAEHRSGIVLGQEAVAHTSNEIPAVRTLVTGAEPARARRDPPRDACPGPDRPVPGRAVRRALRDDRDQGQPLRPARRPARARFGTDPKCAPASIAPRTKDTDGSRSAAAGCSTSRPTPTRLACPIAKWPSVSSASAGPARAEKSSTRPSTV